MSNFQTDSIVFFGDSYTDGGRLTQLVSAATGLGFNPLLNPEIFTEGQANNGFNYANFLPVELGLDDSNVQNFAVSGARALVDRDVAEFLSAVGLETGPDAPESSVRVDLDAQVSDYLASLPEGEAPDNATASLFMGINDVNAPDYPVTGDSVEADAKAYGDRLYDEVQRQAERLADAGVDNLILYTIPKQGDLPLQFGFFPADVLAASDIASAHFNDRLLNEVNTFEDLGLNVKVIDFAELFDEVRGDFTTFGFQAFDDPQTLDFANFNPAVDGIPEDQIAMTDVIHPAEKFNEAMLQFELGLLNGNSEIGTSGSDFLKGTKSKDMILGRDGSDFINLGRGDDVGLGGLGADIIKGDRGDDLISGGSGADLLKGGRGDDVIADGAGDDRTIGGRGDDVLIDGLGSDVHLGCRGDDVFIFTEQSLYGADDSADSNLFVGGRGDDHLLLRLEEDTAAAYEAGDISLEDLGIKARGIESVEVVVGLDLPEYLVDNPLVADAQDWGFV
ncbi:SGNH/GDSL hydrolase family protein [Ruegeria arenilitoris]|uniref:SGNH/GDSL hydrolase family protein n=1 Tax=Ruegeria arenilitoris TaxID=1173585 RepID=UPI00147FF59D|nr:SGNH/GDSL hydrolase family protein [Ruegeria arenilitoris]